MSEWYPLIKYGVFAGIPAAIMICYVLRVRVTIFKIVLAPLAAIIAVPPLLEDVLRTDQQVAVAVGAGLLAGYVIALVGRYLRRRWLRNECPPDATRPWHMLPEEARRGLRAPGDLGDHGGEDDFEPLQLIGNR